MTLVEWGNLAGMEKSPATSVWKNCSICGKPIGFGAPYWACNVSTCNKKTGGFSFCSVECWDVHLPTMNHREAWAEERKAPPKPAPKDSSTVESASARKTSASTDGEILVVASKVRDYIESTAGMNTSAKAYQVLSDHIRNIADQAIAEAQRQGRLTVMDRDLPKSKAAGKSNSSVIIRRRRD